MNLRIRGYGPTRETARRGAATLRDAGDVQGKSGAMGRAWGAIVARGLALEWGMFLGLVVVSIIVIAQTVCPGGVRRWEPIPPGGTGGQSVATLRERAVVDVRYLTNGLRECAGVLISPAHSLTARHCVADELVGVDGHRLSVLANPLRVTIRTMGSGAPRDIPVKAVLGVTDKSEVASVDAAVLVLSEPITDAEPAPLSADEAMVGTTFGVLGLLPAGKSRWPRRGTAHAKALGLRVRCKAADCSREAKVTPLEWMGDSGPCLGDSGAPAIDQVGHLIGIVVRGRIGKDGACLDPVFQDIGAIRADLLELIGST